jgi:hypothetical protein
MAARFDRDGIGLSFPENWKLDLEDSENGWTISLQSPDTAFLLVSLYEDMPESAEVAQTTLDAMRAEYEDLESEEIFETVAGQPAVGHDIRFFSLDLTNTCWVRSFYGANGTVLVFWQTTDMELIKNGPVLDAICASLTVEED